MALWNGFAKAVPVTPNDSTDLNSTGSTVADALLVVNTGNIVLTPAQGSNVTITGAPCGMFIPIKTKRVLATGTTATVVALWGQ